MNRSGEPDVEPTEHDPASPPDGLELIPRSIRDKLDRVGTKLHLRDWQAMSLQERKLLRDLPCVSHADAARYVEEVDRLVTRITGKPAPRLPSRG